MAWEEHQTVTRYADTVEKSFTAEVGQIDNKSHILHIAAEPPDKLYRGTDSTAGSEHRVPTTSALSPYNQGDSVFMDFQAVGTVF